MSTQPSEPQYEVVWPLGRTHQDDRPSEQAERLPDLAGRRVGFLWDFLFNGDEIFDSVRDELNARFDGMSFVGWNEFGNFHAADEDEVMAQLPLVLNRHGVDAVVVGVGA